MRADIIGLAHALIPLPRNAHCYFHANRMPRLLRGAKSISNGKSYHRLFTIRGRDKMYDAVVALIAQFHFGRINFRKDALP